ncbi:glutamyl-tRNA reductase [Microbacterium sp. LRZ72]|uniref:glutamyl-tRNA reductase n=1 Tax=Microbacterium sp. LRZ72 TaxID=2942481 RepID=UPI0029A8F723|nr:glutamyl-tRNA reductase [Microbacterium sp. LRZ72]MDX2376408.1 glutamyl-tRNA reductase [Microbacterium sp. LRZ72]
MLLCVTASHKTADFDLLERLSVHTSDIAPLIAEHDACVRGAVVLATCNRFEAYLDMDDPVTAVEAVGVEAALLAIEAATGVDAHEFEGSYRVVTGPPVAEHLFSVASGLESVVVGEGEIAGQVRRALGEARRHGTSSPELERLFQRASEAQRGVKNATALSRAGRSLVRLALDLADSRVTDWSDLQVLLVGTGAYAAATLAALRDRGADHITVHSPSGRGHRFATKHGLAWTDAAGFARTAAAADLVITCTSADHHVLDARVLTEGRGALAEEMPAAAEAASACPAMPGAYGGGRTLVVDLGLPRNVDPDVATVAGVDLLDLETIRLHAPLDELQATDAAREIVRDAAARFAQVGERQNLTPAVVALRAHVFGILESEIERLRDDDGRTEQALRHLVGRLVHTPTVRAQELATQGRAADYVAALDALFGITPAMPQERGDAEGRDAASA